MDAFGLARMPLGKLLQTAAGDIHPPGYPLALKIFLRLFGDSWTVARMFSVLTVGGAAALLSRCSRSRGVGVAAAGFFLLLPATGFCATDLRMYGLTMFFLAAFMLCADRIAADGAAWPWLVGLSVSAWGGALTLNYACLYLAAVAAPLLWTLWRRGDRRGCLLATAALASAFAAYLPWLGSAWRQLLHVRSGFWAPPLTLKMAVLILDAPFMGYSLNFISTLLPVVAAVSLLALGLSGAYRHRARERLRRLTGGIIWSLLRGRALVIDRVMLPAAVPLALALGESVAAPYLHRAFKLAALAVFGLFFIYHTGCLIYRTRDGVLDELRDTLRSDYAGYALFYGDAHAAADGAGLVPERLHTVVTAEADPMGILVLGNVRVTERPARAAKRVFILAEEPPESFRARASGVGELVEERHFYSRYRFQHFHIFREAAFPPEPPRSKAPVESRAQHQL